MSDDPAARLLEALDALRDVGDSLTPDEAIQELDTASLQMFWRDWPNVSGWAGQVWRTLNNELADAARPHEQGDELGGSG